MGILALLAGKLGVDSRTVYVMTQPGEDLHELDGTRPGDARGVETPDADAYEQAIPADPAQLPADLRLAPDADEADALEQSQVVDLDEDYR
jgi:hypothetical protein